MVLFVHMVLLLLIKISQLCEYELHRMDGADTIAELRRAEQFGVCDCVDARGSRLHNCTHSCDVFNLPHSGCFWTCADAKLSINSLHMRECYCQSVPPTTKVRPCRNYPMFWRQKSNRSHGCCRLSKESGVCFCIGSPRQTHKLLSVVKSLCDGTKTKSNVRLAMLCKIARAWRDQVGQKTNGFLMEILLRISDYVTDDITRVTTPPTLRVTSRYAATSVTARTLSILDRCANCPIMASTELRLPIWVTAVAGVGGLMVGFIIAICVSRCFLRPMGERELKKAMISASEAVHSDTSALHSMAPLIATNSNSSSGRRNLPSESDNRELYDRRHVIGASTNSADFHQYESLTRFGKLPDIKSEYLEPTVGITIPANETSSSHVAGRQLAVPDRTSHEYFALEEMSGANRTPDVGSDKPHDYITVIDDSEEDGAPARRHSNTQTRSNEYFVLDKIG